MMRLNWRHWLGVAALSLTCIACGDGGSGVAPQLSGGGSTPTPMPSPTPTSTFGTLGQTRPQNFASYGYAYSGTDAGFGYNPVEGTVDLTFVPTLRLAENSQLLLSVPGIGEGMLKPDGSFGRNPQFGIIYRGYSAPGGHATIQSIVRPDGSSLFAYVAQAGWVSNPDPARPDSPYKLSSFIYGVASQPAALPTAGVQTYIMYLPSGARTNLTIDFFARTVTGAFDLTDSAGPTTYSLEKVVFAGDGSQFSGQLVASDNSVKGTIDGRFTGPSGQELMGRSVINGSPDPQVVLWTGYRE